MDIQAVQILFQIINFGVVLGALTFLLYKPVVKTLQRRSDKIAESQKAADEVLAQRDAIEELKKKATSAAKQETAKLLAEAKEQADAKKAELMKVAKEDVKGYVVEEKAKWDKEKARLLKQMEADFTSGVFQVVDKVLGAGVIDKKTHAKLIDQSITDITKTL